MAKFAAALSKVILPPTMIKKIFTQ
jgi:hypothetical protein